MRREGKLAGRSVCFSRPPCALRQFLHFPALLESELCSASAGRGHGGGDCGVGVEGDEGGQKDTSWISSSLPRRTLSVWPDSGPGGLQLRILRVLPGVCSQQKHIESVANYEFSIHFVLLPGSFLWRLVFLMHFKRTATPLKFQPFQFSTRGI